MPTHTIKHRMNEAGASKTPFLFAVDFELSEGIFIERPLRQQDILFHTPLGGNKPVDEAVTVEAVSLVSYPKPYAEYKAQFDVVMTSLRRGDSFLTNLTVKTPVETSLSLREIALLSRSPYQLYVPGRFVCFSPERFVRIGGDGTVSTNPMKGTINAGVPDAEQTILSDAKETAEHYTIVDLLRNDLGMVAEKIQVERLRYIDRIRVKDREILQVSSEIKGQLNASSLRAFGDVIFGMLPAGSVSGAPKQSTVNIIRKAEKEPRGYYTGVFGYFDGEVLDSAVLIRYIEESVGQMYFRSGGGITACSDPMSEYNEVIEKIYLPFI